MVDPELDALRDRVSAPAFHAAAALGNLAGSGVSQASEVVVDLYDFEAEFAGDAEVNALITTIGHNVVSEAAIEETVGYGSIVRRLGEAEISVFDESYFRIPLSGDQGAILEVLATPYKVNLATDPREMLRVTVSSKAFSEENDLPLLVVNEYFIDYAKKHVYSFNGIIDGIAGEGSTIKDVTWSVLVDSPPQIEYNKAEKTTSTVYNDEYEKTVAAAIESGQVTDGSKLLYDQLAWVKDAQPEDVHNYTRDYLH